MSYLKVIFYIIFLNYVLGYSSPLDSIGVEKKNGKTYIQHKITSGETLYRLTKKYNVSLDELKKENPDIEKSFKEGQIVLIPSKAKASTTVETPKQENPTSTSSKMHTVEPGQGLYGIAKMYNIKVDELKKLNGLTGNDVKVGQKLIVGTGETKNEPVKEGNMVTTVHSATVSKNIALSTDPKNQKIIDTLKVVNIKKMDGPSEKHFHYGVGVVFSEPENADKYEAYYDNVPVGKFINIKNMSNGEQVFLLVKGKLPKQSDPKIIIVYSPKVMERLQSADAKLAVEINYIAP